MDSNADLMRVLGRLEQKIENLAEDMKEAKEATKENRDRVQVELAEQKHMMSRLNNDVIINARIVAQQRDHINRLEDTIELHHAQVAPALEDWDDVKKLGKGISWALLAVGISAGSIFWWIGDLVGAWLKRWLNQ